LGKKLKKPYAIIEITGEELRKIVERFSEEVNGPKTTCFARVEYKDWKTLIRFTKKDCLQITFDHTSSSVFIEDSDEFMCFPTNDCSFGEFLTKEFEREDKQVIDSTNHLINALKGAAYTASSCDQLNSTCCSTDYATGYSDFNTIKVSDHQWLPNTAIAVSCDTDSVKSELDALSTRMKRLEDDKRKENEKMKGFNFDFGPVNNNVARLSMYGLAVKNKSGTFVAYDTASGTLMDVDILNFDGAKFLYKMPVAIKDIAVGDVVVHQGVPMFVQAVVAANKTLVVIDPVSGERKEIIMARSPFGFDFATKIVNLLGSMTGGAASADSPFGNMWMLMAMSDNKDFSDMLPLMWMSQSGKVDPMAMYVLMNKDNQNMVPLMWMMMNKPTNGVVLTSN
jgi:hypothetical protein